MPYVKQYGIRQGFKQDLEQGRLEAAKQAGSPVYKYVSAHRAVDCLKKGTLYLASPDQLNDTLEARFNTASTEDFWATINATIAELARQRKEPLSSRDAPSEFNDINQQENKRFQTFCEQVGICALAQRPNHQAMWAHYGEEGEGICLELSLTQEVMDAHQLLLEPVKYSNAPRILNRAEDWRDTFLELTKQYPKTPIDDLLKISVEEPFRRRMGLRMARRAVSVKHSDWAYEEEIRLLGPKGKKPLPILDQVLTQVHFLGTSAISRVAPLLLERYPHVGLMQWTFDHGQLQAQPQPMEFKRLPLDDK